MNNNRNPKPLEYWARLAVTGAILWASIWLLRYLSDILIPFVAAFLLAYLINPLVVKVQRRIKRRVPAVLLTLTLLLLVLLFVVRITLPLMAREISVMGQSLRHVVVTEWSEQIARILPQEVLERIDEYTAEVAEADEATIMQHEYLMPFFHNILQRILPSAQSLINWLGGVVVSMTGFTIVLLYMVFLLIDFDRLQAKWTDYVPHNIRTPVIRMVSDFDYYMRRYFRGQFMVASTVGLLLAIGFGLIGLPLGIIMGLFIGLLNMVPYLQIVGLIPAFLLAIVGSVAQGDPWWQLLLFTALVFACVQTLQDTILVPKIMGKVTGLSPAVILLALTTWGRLLGIFGVLIALPITCLLLAYYRRFISPVEEGNMNHSQSPSSHQPQ